MVRSCRRIEHETLCVATRVLALASMPCINASPTLQQDMSRCGLQKVLHRTAVLFALRGSHPACIASWRLSKSNDTVVLGAMDLAHEADKASAK